MKKPYTKKQIQEAIVYWQKKLSEAIDEKTEGLPEEVDVELDEFELNKSWQTISQMTNDQLLDFYGRDVADGVKLFKEATRNKDRYGQARAAAQFLFGITRHGTNGKFLGFCPAIREYFSDEFPY